MKNVSQVGLKTIAALSQGPRKSFKTLEMEASTTVTDTSVRDLVNACEKLVSVSLTNCTLLTNATMSHLSCSRNLSSICLTMTPTSPVSNRSAVYLSCASSALRSLKLGNCKNVSVNGIVALSKLPGLVDLRLYGLTEMSQDSLRVLGGNPRNSFTKLEYLALEGALQLSDLGVSSLVGQRGHRIVGLELIDRMYNLSDEALEIIGIWCGSLKRLVAHGMFSFLAAQALASNIPDAAMKFFSSSHSQTSPMIYSFGLD
jgi:hypothetical protein